MGCLITLFPPKKKMGDKQVTDNIRKMISKRLSPHHGNKTCWIFTPARWKRIQSLLPKVDMKGNIYVPLEFLMARLDMDFSKKKLWRKVPIRSLLTTEPHFGYLESKRGLRLIIPLSKNQMLTWPLSKAEAVQEYFSRVMGIDDFFEYLGSTEDGKKFLSEIKSRIMQLSKYEVRK